MERERERECVCVWGWSWVGVGLELEQVSGGYAVICLHWIGKSAWRDWSVCVCVDWAFSLMACFVLSLSFSLRAGFTVYLWTAFPCLLILRWIVEQSRAEQSRASWRGGGE